MLIKSENTVYFLPKIIFLDLSAFTPIWNYFMRQFCWHRLTRWVCNKIKVWKVLQCIKYFSHIVRWVWSEEKVWHDVKFLQANGRCCTFTTYIRRLIPIYFGFLTILRNEKLSRQNSTEKKLHYWCLSFRISINKISVESLKLQSHDYGKVNWARWMLRLKRSGSSTCSENFILIFRHSLAGTHRFWRLFERGKLAYALSTIMIGPLKCVFANNEQSCIRA